MNITEEQTVALYKGMRLRCSEDGDTYYVVWKSEQKFRLQEFFKSKGIESAVFTIKEHDRLDSLSRGDRAKVRMIVSKFRADGPYIIEEGTE